MSAAARVHPEPVDRLAPGTGSGVSEALRPELERVLEWAGDGLVALVLAGSHASGEAVWARHEGRAVTLSDLDLYAVMRDRASCERARARAREGRAAATTGALAAPLEVAWLTAGGLARMAARPGTLEFARTARVIAGDPAALVRSPHWNATQVSAEERLLLLENRAFELLWAWLAPGPGLLALRARHAVLKTALETAASRVLALGEWPEGAVARVERARSLAEPDGLPVWLRGAWAGLDPLWSEALAWRSPGRWIESVPELAPAWHTAVRGWASVWWGEAAPGVEPHDAFERARLSARRGSLARRLRRSAGFRANAGPSPTLFSRLERAVHGTPAHRIHGSAVVLVLAASGSESSPRLSGEALRALSALGVTRETGFEGAAREVVLAWDRMLHDGLRTQGAAWSAR